MSGKRVFSWREGDRSEYLANFLLSAIGLVTPVPRQEDIGVDFYCSIADQEKGVLTFDFPFIVQVKSIGSPIVEIKPPDKYIHQAGVIPDHISWIFRQELPMFLALIDKQDISIRLYSLSPVWFIRYDSTNCPNCSSLRLVPRVNEADIGHVGRPTQVGEVTSDPKSFQYEVDLGFPVASFCAKDTEDEAKLANEKNCLRRCIDYALRSLVFFRADLPHFYWIAETDRAKKGPIPAFYYNEIPTDPEYQERIYSFLGPALIPLALRYMSDKRSDLLEALKTLFRQMPSETIPKEVREVLPEVFPHDKQPG